MSRSPSYTPSSSEPIPPARPPSPCSQPPTTNSCRRPYRTLTHSAVRWPGRYVDVSFFATTPSSPLSAAAWAVAGPSSKPGDAGQPGELRVGGGHLVAEPADQHQPGRAHVGQRAHPVPLELVRPPRTGGQRSGGGEHGLHGAILPPSQRVSPGGTGQGGPQRAGWITTVVEKGWVPCARSGRAPSPSGW